MTPRIALGMPVHNAADGLEETIGLLLGQTEGDFGLVVVDDASTDGSAEVARRCAARDERVTVCVNPRRLGLAANWRATFLVARAQHPGAAYFAWVADHDWWAPEWLARLAAALDADARHVLAYPLDARLGRDGLPLDPQTPRFDTAGVDEPLERLERAARAMVAGSMVYGLMRADAVERAGAFPVVVGPDRLLLAQLALAGTFAQVPEVLWRRRVTGHPSTARQRAASWPDGAPAWTRLPWWLVHAAHIARGGRRRAALTYLAISGGRDVRQRAQARAFALEGRLPRALTAPLRRLAGLPPRRGPFAGGG